jgi:hypothetical protein
LNPPSFKPPTSVTSPTVTEALEAVVGVVPPPLVVVPPQAASNMVNKTRNVVMGARPLILRILASFLSAFEK